MRAAGIQKSRLKQIVWLHLERKRSSENTNQKDPQNQGKETGQCNYDIFTDHSRKRVVARDRSR